MAICPSTRSTNWCRSAKRAWCGRTRKSAASRGWWGYDPATSTSGQCSLCPILARLNVAIGQELRAAMDGRRGLAAADSLCEACVMLFGIDAAALSLVFAGVTNGTFGSSDAAARVYDELQFTIGEGPCLDSVETRAPVLVPDLAEPASVRWPLYRPAMLDHKIRGV